MSTYLERRAQIERDLTDVVVRHERAGFEGMELWSSSCEESSGHGGDGECDCPTRCHLCRVVLPAGMVRPVATILLERPSGTWRMHADLCPACGRSVRSGIEGVVR